MREWFNFLGGSSYPSAYYERIDTVVPTRQTLVVRSLLKFYLLLIVVKLIILNRLYII